MGVSLKNSLKYATSQIGIKYTSVFRPPLGPFKNYKVSIICSSSSFTFMKWRYSSNQFWISEWMESMVTSSSLFWHNGVGSQTLSEHLLKGITIEKKTLSSLSIYLCESEAVEDNPFKGLQQIQDRTRLLPRI